MDKVEPDGGVAEEEEGTCFSGISAASYCVW